MGRKMDVLKMEFNKKCLITDFCHLYFGEGGTKSYL
jgi:hypothetical protein